MTCEDYPCCGHTPADPCERQPYDEPGHFDTSIRGNEHALCDHENDECDVDYDEPDECDPPNSVCVNDNDDCDDCREYWLDFHADGMREDMELRE